MPRLVASLLVAVLALDPVGSAWGGEADDAEMQHALDHIRTSPLAPGGFAELAQILFRDGDFERAHAAAAEAARLAPEDAAVQRQSGYMAAAAGAEAEAAAAFRRAAAIDPRSRTEMADFHLARAWAEYQDVLRRSGPDPDVLERLRELAAAMEIHPELKAMVRRGPFRGNAPRSGMTPPVLLAAGVDTAVVVEKKTQTVRVYGRRDDGIELLQTYPCTTGQAEGAKEQRGDLRTPDGIYFFSRLIPGERLPDHYGALALTLTYPNAFDREAQRSGSGIWFHGSDRLASPFSPRDSKGCVILRNDDLLELATLVEPMITPVLIAEEVPERPAAAWSALFEDARRRESLPAPAAVVAAAEYVLAMRLDGTAAHYEFFPAAGEVVHDVAAVPARVDWEAALRQVRAEYAGSLLTVAALENGVLIETSSPVQARLYRPEMSRRIYLDLPGVFAGPVPKRYPGRGVIAGIRVSPVSLDPPLTRVVIDLTSAATGRLESAGNQITLLLSCKGVGAPDDF